jgi:hypothetical protein
MKSGLREQLQGYQETLCFKLLANQVICNLTVLRVLDEKLQGEWWDGRDKVEAAGCHVDGAWWTRGGLRQWMRGS